MSFLSGIYDAVKRKHAELKERKEFLDMVETKAKPIRRASYMNQMLKEVVKEGIQKAKTDAEARVPQKRKTQEDFGIMTGIENPYKFLNSNKKTNKSRGRKK